MIVFIIGRLAYVAAIQGWGNWNVDLLSQYVFLKFNVDGAASEITGSAGIGRVLTIVKGKCCWWSLRIRESNETKEIHKCYF